MKKRFYSLLLCFILVVSAVAVTSVPVSAAPAMKASDDCIAMIKSFEGFNKFPYWDHSQYTVGYGVECPEEDYDRFMEEGITEEEASELLCESITKVEKAVNWFANKNGLTFTQAQFDALVDFTYNCGSGWMMGEYKFRNAVINGTTGNEFVEVIASWCTASGKVYSGLLNRRLCDANLYLNGVYSTSASSYYSYVLYNAHGGSLSTTGYQIFPVGTTADFRLTATRAGYEFLGWYTKSSNGTQVTSLDDSLNGKTLHAYWNGPADGSDEVESPQYDITEVNYQKIVSVSNYLNIREEPDSSSDATGKLANGDVVSIVGEATVNDVTWGQLREGGWICLKYTTEYTEPEEKPEDEEEETESKISVTTKTVLNVRSGVGTNHAVSDTLASGETVTITKVSTDGDGNAWGKLAEGGWICLVYTTYEKNPDDTTENTPENKTKIKITNGPLNVRNGAGTSYDVRTALATGKSVTIVETKNVANVLWGKLADGGWICLAYTNYNTAAGDSTEEDTSSAGKTVKVTDGPLNVRSGAGTSSAVQKSLAVGTSVTIVSTKTVSGTNWGELSSGGWICLTYTDYAGSSGSSTGSSGSTAVEGTVSTSGGLNIRATASTSASVVGAYINGTKVKILEQKTVDGVAWGRTNDGWICMNYIKTFGGADAGTTRTVTGDVVNVRNGAGMSYDVVKTVTKGTSIMVTETKTDSSGMTWGKISGVGWISMSYVA